MGKLQALGAVQRHQKDPVVSLLDVIDIRHESNILQKSREGGFLVLVAHPLFKIGELAHKLLDIVLPVLGVLFPRSPERFDISSGLQDKPAQLDQRVGQGILSALMDHLRKGPELESRLFDVRDLVSSFHDLEEGLPGERGVVCRPCDGRRPDAPFGDIDDAAHCQVIPAVIDGLEITEDVLDLPAVIEIGAAHHIVGDRPQDQPFLDETGSLQEIVIDSHDGE